VAVSVEVRSLSFGYKEFRLSIDGLRFESRRVASIVGRNGAGKSTLLKCLGGVLPVPRGSVSVGGRDLADLKSAERARLISYVPQEIAPALNYGVLDFVLMGRAAFIPTFSVPSREDRRLAEEAIDFVGLGGFEDREFSQLSSGERRIALVARTLAQSPEVFLLDEPTTFLDPKHEVEVMGLCRKLAAEKGKTVIVTLHNLELAVKCSDEMVFLKKGRVAASGPPDRVLSEALLEEVYDIPMAIVPFEGRKLIVR
jgi:iron complex transport system ATP-binding protein